MSNIFEQEFEVEGFSLGMFDLFGRQVVPRKIRWAREGGGLGGGGQVRAIIPCQATHCLPPSPGASLYLPLPHSCTSHVPPPSTSMYLPCTNYPLPGDTLSVRARELPPTTPAVQTSLLVKNAIVGRTKSFFDWTKTLPRYISLGN